VHNNGDFGDSTGASALSFFGRFRLKLDAKGRLTLPAIHRRVLEETEEWMALRPGSEGFIQVIPAAQWQRVLAGRRAQASTQARGRDQQWARRLEASEVAVAAIDLKGRITLPRELLESSGIDREALVLGVGAHLEIWNPERYFEAAQGHEVDGGEIDDLLYG